MPATSILPPFAQFTDRDGAPLDGGYIYIGSPGLDAQTNAIVAYWDDAFSIPAAQPIRTLGGYPLRNGSPARVYVPTDFSITVLDGDGTFVYSSLTGAFAGGGSGLSAFYADKFTATAGQTTFTLTTNPASINALDVSLDGSSLVPGDDFTWTQTTLTLTAPAFAGQRLLARYTASAGTATVLAGSVTDVSVAAGSILYDSVLAVNVKHYGAVGNGTTDDTAAIVAALLAGTGKTVLFPPGTYIVDGTLLRVYSGTTVMGYGATLKLEAGTYSTTRYFLGTNTGITYDAGYATTSNVAIFGLTIDGNIANVTTTDSCYGINAYKTSGFLIQDVNILNLPGVIGSGYGIAFSFSTDVQAVNVNINRTDRQNIVVWESKNAKISRCTLKDSYFRDCILVSSNTPFAYQASECIISDTECRNTMSTGTHVIRYSGQSGGQLSNVRIYGYQSGASGLHGLYVADVYPKNIRAVNVTIDDCYRGVEVASDAAHSIELTGCQIGLETACYDGVRVNTNTATCKINGGTIKATNQPLYLNAIDYQSVVGAEIIGGSTNSAVFSESAGSTVFVGNTVRDNTSASYPVLFAGSGEPILVGNKLLGNTANTLRATTGAVTTGNSATTTTIDGAAKPGILVKRNTTANRPTLGTNDVGVLYLDNTLDADGKPIWWNGTAWVDATGATV